MATIEKRGIACKEKRDYKTLCLRGLRGIRLEGRSRREEQEEEEEEEEGLFYPRL